MRYAALLLLAASGACKLDFGPGFNPFHVPPPSSGSHIELATVAVSPTTVRAGSQFVASASATYGGCDGAADIVVFYGPQLVGMGATPFQVSITAVLDQTVVDFHATCVTPSGGALVTPTQDIHITVTAGP